MDKLNVLKQKAIEFESLLKKYAETDGDVADFLSRITPWFIKIKNNQITVPDYDYKLSVYFTNPDLSPLVEKYMFTDLGEMSAQFSLVIRGMSLTEGK